ncbi:ATP/GTP-binding protein [Streptomyces sp. NPDC001340]
MSKIVLLAVFALNLVAAFVKPVGDALQGNIFIGGALLSLLGFLLYNEVHRLNSAHKTQRELRDTVSRLSQQVAELGVAQVTPNHLEEEFRSALWGRKKVQIAVLGFTGETAAPKLKELLNGLPEDGQREVSLRFLLPDFTKPTEVPGLLREGRAGDAPGFRDYLTRKIAGYEADLQEMTGRMRHMGQGTLKVEFRVLQMTPALKLYFINDDRVFEGIYDTFVTRPNPYGPGPGQDAGEGDGELLDLIGHDSLLTRWQGRDGAQAQEMIRRRRKFFDKIWKVAHPLTTVSSNGHVPAPQRQD